MDKKELLKNIADIYKNVDNNEGKKMDRKELFKNISEIYKSVVDMELEINKSTALKILTEDLNSSQKQLESSIRKLEKVDKEHAKRLNDGLLESIKTQIKELADNKYKSTFDLQELSERMSFKYVDLIKKYTSEGNKSFYDLMYNFKIDTVEKHKELNNLIGELKKGNMDLEIVYSDSREVFVLTNSAYFVDFEKSLKTIIEDKEGKYKFVGNPISKIQYFIAPYLNNYPEEPITVIKRALTENMENQKQAFEQLGYSIAIIGNDFIKNHLYCEDEELTNSIAMTLENPSEFGYHNTKINSMRATGFGYPNDVIEEYDLTFYKDGFDTIKIMNIADDVKIYNVLNQKLTKKNKSRLKF